MLYHCQGDHVLCIGVIGFLLFSLRQQKPFAPSTFVVWGSVSVASNARRGRLLTYTSCSRLAIRHDSRPGAPRPPPARAGSSSRLSWRSCRRGPVGPHLFSFNDPSPVRQGSRPTPKHRLSFPSPFGTRALPLVTRPEQGSGSTPWPQSPAPATWSRSVPSRLAHPDSRVPRSASRGDVPRPTLFSGRLLGYRYARFALCRGGTLGRPAV